MIKQVIIIAKYLNMRRGKQIAQGCHASLNAYFNAVEQPHSVQHTNATVWLTVDNMTKICVSVDSEQELFDVYNKAGQAGLPSALIMYAGKTEFNGVPTLTSCAIGPALAEDIDKITSSLKLL